VSITQAYAIAAYYKEFGREPDSVGEAVDFYKKKQTGAFQEIS
jgi:hypothetical protein